MKQLLIGLFILTSAFVFGRETSENPTGKNSVKSTTKEISPTGGQATISGGTILLLTFAVVYGAKKVYELKKKDTS